MSEKIKYAISVVAFSAILIMTEFIMMNIERCKTQEIKSK